MRLRGRSTFEPFPLDVFLRVGGAGGGRSARAGPSASSVVRGAHCGFLARVELEGVRVRAYEAVDTGFLGLPPLTQFQGEAVSGQGSVCVPLGSVSVDRQLVHGGNAILPWHQDGLLEELILAGEDRRDRVVGEDVLDRL